MWILEVKLNTTYSKIAESISSFNWQPLKEFTGMKKQPVQVIKSRDSTKYDDDVILFVDPNQKTLAHWRKKILKQQYKRLKIKNE